MAKKKSTKKSVKKKTTKKKHAKRKVAKKKSATKVTRRKSKKKAGGTTTRTTAAVKKKRAAAGSADSTQWLEPDSDEVIIRMYRQGLGDCFLLAFGTKKNDEPRFVLIDCGVHRRETEGTKRLLQVMENITAVTDNHLHVVAATHEHADHLSGFVQKGSPFLKDDLKIDKLWVAWTEEVGDPQADRLRAKRGTARRVIKKAVKQARERANSAGLGATPLQDFADRLEDVVAFEVAAETAMDEAHEADVLKKIKQLAQGTDLLLPRMRRPGEPLLGATDDKPERPSSNELALGLLAAKADAVYCEPANMLQIDGVDNVRAFVLGPPRDEKLLKKDLPTKIRGGGEHEYKETYLAGSSSTEAFSLSPALYDDLSELDVDRQFPFATSYHIPFKEDENSPKMELDKEKTEAKGYIEGLYGSEDDGDKAWRRIDGDWLGTAEQLALHLDSDTNNTSLVLAFELCSAAAGDVLLFPGDAQVGNWLSWRDQDYTAHGKTASADDLMKRTLVYKVGHHGSHNATVKADPRDKRVPGGEPFGLELMDDIIALIPVDRAAADKKMPSPWRMPHRPLYQRLREKAKRRVLRADESLKPLPKSEPADVRPDSHRWHKVPGKPGILWRAANEDFMEGTPGPLYYDIKITIK